MSAVLLDDAIIRSQLTNRFDMPSLCSNGNRSLCCGLWGKKRRFWSKISEDEWTCLIDLFYLEYQSRKSSIKRGDFGIVNIVQEATPILPEQEPMVSATRLDSSQPTTATEQTSQMFDEIRKFDAPTSSLVEQSLPATRNAPQIPVVERSFKSKFIPDQARALANAIKQAVVRPLKKSRTKRKSSSDAIVGKTNDQSIHRSSVPVNHLTHELSIDSNESTSPIALTPPPPKPPRQIEESDSSSSIDIHLIPPAKPPRHFSLYRHEHKEDLIHQTDQIVRRVLHLVDTFGIVSPDTNRPNEIVRSNVETPLTSTLLNDSSETSTLTQSSDDVIQPEITQLATDLAERIVKESQVSIRSMRTNDRQVQMKRQTKDQTLPILSQAMVSMHVTPARTTLRPLMFVSLDFTGTEKKAISLIRDITTTKPKPLVTTSVRVSSPTHILLSSSTTITTSDEEYNSNSTLISKNSITSTRSSFVQTSSERRTLDSVNNILRQTMTTPSQSIRSDENIHQGSATSLTDDHQQCSVILPPHPSLSETISSSISTIYESLDNCPSSETSRSYVTAASSLNGSGTSTPSRRCDSDRTDEDLSDSFEIERSSTGRMDPHSFPLACRFRPYSSMIGAWPRSFASLRHSSIY